MIKEFFRPRSIAEAVERMAEDPARGAYVAGGTEILLKDRALEFIVDLTSLGLSYIHREGDELRLGATTTIREVERSPELRELAGGILYQCAKQFSSLQLRNMATVGGNIAGAVPSADFPPPLIALGAKAVIADGGQRTQTLPLEEIFLGPRRTVLESAILKELIIPIPPPAARGRFLKIARTSGGIALANLAALVEEDGVCKEVTIVVGGLAPTPLRVKEAEDLLRGKALTEENILKAAEIVAERVSPSFHRASPEYRRRLSYVLTERALLDSSKEVGWSSM